MISEEYTQYLRSETWQNLRSQRLKIDHYKCQRCGRPFDLQVHHLYYPDELGTEDVYRDLITLCDYCHEEIEQQKKDYKLAQNAKKSTTYKIQKDITDMLVRQFIREHKSEDLSNVGVGKKNYCDHTVIQKDFFPFMAEHGVQDDHPSGSLRIQEYFRNRRYEVILQLKARCLTPYRIQQRTGFSMNMISQVFDNDLYVKEALRKEKEMYPDE